jgi:hypothetical protein
MRRTLAIALVFSAALPGAGAALASDESLAREQRAPQRGYAIEPAPLGLRLVTPAFGLRLEYEPPESALEPYPRAPSYESPFGAGTDHALRFWRWDLGQAEGWSAFGAYGSMRFSKDFKGDSDTTLRFGGGQVGAPGQPDRLNLGIRYRFRF